MEDYALNTVLNSLKFHIVQYLASKMQKGGRKTAFWNFTLQWKLSFKLSWFDRLWSAWPNGNHGFIMSGRYLIEILPKNRKLILKQSRYNWFGVFVDQNNMSCLYSVVHCWCECKSRDFACEFITPKID